MHSFRRRRLSRMLWVATLVAALFAPLVGTAQADPPEVTFGPANEFATGLVPRSVAIGDLNADTLPDVVTANSGSDSVSVLLGDGAGSFGATTDFGTADQPASVVILDLDGDTVPDLAVANAGSGSVSVLLGDGAGGFGAKTDFATGTDPVSVAVGDLDGDTFADLAVARYSAAEVSVLLGDGAGGFGAPVDFATGSGSASVAMGDLDSDTFLDLVVAVENGYRLSVLLGDGAGGFSTATEFATGAEPFSVALGDLDGDTFLDLVAANSGDVTVSVLLGDGAGGFGTRTDFGVLSLPTSVAIGDLNGDAFVDLVAANTGGDDLSVLAGDGTGAFGPATNVSPGGFFQPLSVAMADLDGDADLDLVTGDISGSGVAVLLNTTGLLVVPGAPTIQRNATAGHGSATVNWTASPPNGGPAVTGYVVTPYIGYYPLAPQSFSSTATTQTVTGLTNGTTYRFKVAATNAVGTGPMSKVTNPVTPAMTAPGAPTIGAALAGDGEATVSWTAPVSDGGSPITGYVVTPYIGYYPLAPLSFSSMATTQVVVGLSNGTTYRFRVRAINAVGTGGYSKVTNPVTPTP